MIAMKHFPCRSNLKVYLIGILTGILGVLLCNLWMSTSSVCLTPSNCGTNCQNKAMITKFEKFSESVFKEKMKLNDSFSCLQCDTWPKPSTVVGNHWNYETFLQKHLLEILKGALSGHSVRTETMTQGVHNTPIPFNEAASFYGLVWPRFGFTMIGMVRLNSLQQLLEDVIFNNIEGDFMECGCWRGGASIFARSVFVIYRSPKRVYVADSFAGLPVSRSKRDSNVWSEMEYLRVSLDEVQHNFKRFGVFDKKNVIFLKGFFNETMPKAHSDIGRLSVLRLDGDMYESCFDILSHMYSHVSVKGYVIVDDWTGFPCKSAVLEIRSELGIQEPIHQIDAWAAYWQKEVEINYNVRSLYKKLFKT